MFEITSQRFKTFTLSGFTDELETPCVVLADGFSNMIEVTFFDRIEEVKYDPNAVCYGDPDYCPCDNCYRKLCGLSFENEDEEFPEEVYSPLYTEGDSEAPVFGTYISDAETEQILVPFVPAFPAVEPISTSKSTDITVVIEYDTTFSKFTTINGSLPTFKESICRAAYRLIPTGHVYFGSFKMRDQAYNVWGKPLESNESPLCPANLATPCMDPLIVYLQSCINLDTSFKTYHVSIDQLFDEDFLAISKNAKQNLNKKYPFFKNSKDPLYRKLIQMANEDLHEIPYHQYDPLHNGLYVRLEKVGTNLFSLPITPVKIKLRNTLPFNMHFHQCKSCGESYAHRHFGGDLYHGQRDHQCPNPWCDQYHFGQDDTGAYLLINPGKELNSRYYYKPV